ncbi:MAG: dockerin type I repeat-containing protein [Clostridia bacterium]|nr:dockerin type I repeat-containing protein [Clostridia bacterium]
MRNVNKLLSLLLAMLMLCQGIVLVSAEERTEALEWTYDNSMLIKINTEEAKIFTPEDFPDTNCTEVLTTEKLPTETGYSYELMLIFDTAAEGFDWQAIADGLLERGIAVEVERNIYAEDYNSKICKVTLTHNDLLVPIGGTASLGIESVDFAEFDYSVYDTKAVLFTVDPDIIDETAFTAESFSETGIVEFYPQIEWTQELGWGDELILINRPEEYLGKASDSHSYYGAVDWYGLGDKACVTAINALTEMEGILSATIIIYDRKEGLCDTEIWGTKTDIVSVSLSGGTQDPNNGNVINQNAEIKGKAEGVTEVYVTRRNAVTASCNVTVYLADANNDGECDSLDAALVLKYDAEMAEATEELLLCDMNSDGIVNSLDAAFILRYDAELE